MCVSLTVSSTEPSMSQLTSPMTRRRGGAAAAKSLLHRRLRHEARVRRVPEDAVEEHGQVRQPVLERAFVQLRLPQVLVERERRPRRVARPCRCSANTTLCTAWRRRRAREQVVEPGRLHRDGAESVDDLLRAERHVAVAGDPDHERAELRRAGPRCRSVPPPRAPPPAPPRASGTCRSAPARRRDWARCPPTPGAGRAPTGRRWRRRGRRTARRRSASVPLSSVMRS